MEKYNWKNPRKIHFCSKWGVAKMWFKSKIPSTRSAVWHVCAAVFIQESIRVDKTHISIYFLSLFESMASPPLLSLMLMERLLISASYESRRSPIHIPPASGPLHSKARRSEGQRKRDNRMREHHSLFFNWFICFEQALHTVAFISKNSRWYLLFLFQLCVQI